jgi:ClpP class serine protease
MAANRDIESFLLSGRFEIEEAWGVEQLAQYLQELALLDAGVPYAELGIGARRAQCAGAVICAGALVPGAALADAATVPAGSIAHLQLRGVMRAESGLSNSGVSSLVNDLRAAYANPNIEGIMLEVNTGGGESLAGSMLQSAIADSPKAVVAYAHFMASAGVRGTAPADEIIAASEGTEIGSIGTMISLNKSYLQAYKQWAEDVYATKSPNKNAHIREYLKGNPRAMQEYVDRHNEVFLGEMKRYRELKGDVEHTLSGAMFTAREAKRRGLIDGIGSWEYALSRLEANMMKRRKKS